MSTRPEDYYAPLSDENANTGGWIAMIVVAAFFIVGIVVVDIVTGMSFTGWHILNIVLAGMAIGILAFVIYRIKTGENRGIKHKEIGEEVARRKNDDEFQREAKYRGLNLSPEEEEKTPQGRESTRTAASTMFREE